MKKGEVSINSCRAVPKILHMLKGIIAGGRKRKDQPNSRFLGITEQQGKHGTNTWDIRLFTANEFR